MTGGPGYVVGSGRVRYAGPDSDDPFTFRWYDADRVVAGRRMEDHLRMAVCYWHSFVWPGADVFGDGTFDRPWNAPGLEPMAAARQKMAAAFEFFAKLGTPFFCFHDRDIAPEGRTLAETNRHLDALVAHARALQLPLDGLMCIPPVDDDAAPHFAFLLKRARDLGLPNLSMGMSGDFELAIKFGATHVRVGSAIFGARS